MPWWIVVSNSLIIHMKASNPGNRRRSEGSVEAMPFQYSLFFLGQHLIASVLLTLEAAILFQIFAIFTGIFIVVFMNRNIVSLQFLTCSLICSQRLFITNIISKTRALHGH